MNSPDYVNARPHPPALYYFDHHGKRISFDGFETFSKKKGGFLQSRWTPLSLLRPPYSNTSRRLLKFIVGA